MIATPGDEQCYFKQEIRISDQGSHGYARATACNLHIEQRLFGYRMKFSLKNAMGRATSKAFNITCPQIEEFRALTKILGMRC